VVITEHGNGDFPMAKIISKQVVETRNGCEIELIQESIELTAGGTTNVPSYRVLTSSKPRRIVDSNLGSLAAAQALADQQPPRDVN
jgi:hypothetical protein